MATQTNKTKLLHPTLVFWLIMLVVLMLILMILPYITK